MIYEGDVLCVTGQVVPTHDVQLSTRFEIRYKGETAVRITMTPGLAAPHIETIQDASFCNFEYRGEARISVRLWDGVLRVAPLPGEGPYVIDPDGHVRIPKPEELAAIWASERKPGFHPETWIDYSRAIRGRAGRKSATSAPAP